MRLFWSKKGFHWAIGYWRGRTTTTARNSMTSRDWAQLAAPGKSVSTQSWLVEEDLEEFVNGGERVRRQEYRTEAGG
jgi:hypothetical protein